MIRRFALSSDNLPITSAFQIQIEAGVNRYLLETGMRVNWAIITVSNITANNANFFAGPYSWDADGATTYDISTEVGQDISYVQDSLMLFYNGQLLTQGDEYEETNAGDVFDGHSFKFKTASLDPLPAAGEKISVAFKDSTAVTLSGNETVDIVSKYPNVASGMYVSLVGFSIGETVNLTIVYG